MRRAPSRHRVAVAAVVGLSALLVSSCGDSGPVVVHAAHDAPAADSHAAAHERRRRQLQPRELPARQGRPGRQPASARASGC